MFYIFVYTHCIHCAVVMFDIYCIVAVFYYINCYCLLILWWWCV